jgi:malate dehydrogenase (oxaloacetate-decarboxylating)
MSHVGALSCPTREGIDLSQQLKWAPRRDSATGFSTTIVYMRHLAAPFDDIVAGRPTRIGLAGLALLGNRLLTKDTAFSHAERDAFALTGLLPDAVLTIEDQVELELEHLRAKDSPIEQYIGLAALQDRNATLFYRLLTDHLEEFLPIVYTPTVGLACEQYSHVIRHTRGTWITPADRGRIPTLLRQGPFDDVRLIVVTDNERILGLGDQGAGGMAIPIGKLALYTAASGIHPSLTLPVSLDVGTDNPRLLADPHYLGYRAPRLRGSAYDELVEAFVAGVQEVWPGCLIQWEDFKQHNALAILDRYRQHVPSFNDDIQETAVVVVAAVLGALRATGQSLPSARVLFVGAGGAGIGAARLLRLAMHDAGLDADHVRQSIALADSRGLVHAGRADLDPAKAEFAVASPDDGDGSLVAAVRARRPTFLVGTTGVAGTFGESVIRAMVEALDPTETPTILPLSNPTSSSEATPAQCVAWSGGRALVATGSPFEPVETDGGRVEVAQANNVYVFPGVGLGAIVSAAPIVTDQMFLAAARTLAASVSDERLRARCLFPPISDLRAVARSIALAVAGPGFESEIDAAMWQPAYVPYEPDRSIERRQRAAD